MPSMHAATITVAPVDAIKTSAPRSTGGKDKPRKPASPGQILVVLAFGLLLVAALTIPYNDAWRDKSYQKLSLAELADNAAAHPTDPLVLFWYGRRLNDEGRVQEARTVLEQAAHLAPDTTRIRDQWAQTQLVTGQVGEAYSQLKQFAVTHPQDAEAHLLLGKLHFTLGADRLAEESLRTATRLAPEETEAWALLGDLYQRNNRNAEAVEALQTSLRLQPNRAGAQAALGHLLAENDPKSANAALQRAVTLDPANAEYHREWADILHRQGNNEQAEVQAREALRLAAQDAEAHLILGQCLLARNQLDEAERSLIQAADLSPFAPQPALELQRLYGRLQNKIKAEEWARRYSDRQAVASEGRALSELLLQNPRSAALHHKMAKHQALLGNVEACVSHTARALGAPPDAPAVVSAVAAQLRAVGRTAQAATLEHQMATSASK